MTIRNRSPEVLAERSGAHEQPRAPRVSIHIPVLINGGGYRIAGAVKDLSENGFRMETREPVGAGQSIRSLRDLEGYAAEVLWAEALQVGGVSTADQKPRW